MQVENYFFCSVCGKSFRLKNTLVSHQKVHVSKKSYSGKCVYEKKNDGKHCGDRYEGCGCRNLWCQMESGLKVVDDNMLSIVKSGSEDSPQELSVKEEKCSIVFDSLQQLTVKEERDSYAFDSFQQCLVKEEIDIHEIPFEDQESEVFEN